MRETIQKNESAFVSTKYKTTTVFQDCCVQLDDLNALLQKLLSLV